MNKHLLPRSTSFLISVPLAWLGLFGFELLRSLLIVAGRLSASFFGVCAFSWKSRTPKSAFNDTIAIRSPGLTSGNKSRLRTTSILEKGSSWTQRLHLLSTDAFGDIPSCWAVPVSEAPGVGRLLKFESALPLLTCRRCEARWVPRRGVKGKMVVMSAASHLAERAESSHV
jgi:hypothetical protein